MNIIRRGDLSSGGTGLGPVTLRAACLILSAAALLTVPACEPASESRTDGGSVIFAVEPIRTFGLPDSAALDALPEAQAIGAASLAGIGGIEVSSTGTVYVLDPIWRKVVAFSPDGTPIRVVGAGHGDGPGEFRRPVDLAYFGGRLYVLDLERQAVSVFDTLGGFRRAVALETTAAYREIVVTAEGIWASRVDDRQGRGGAVLLHDHHGRFVRHAFAPNRRDREMDGGGSALAVDPVGDVLLARRQPGEWMRFGRSEKEERRLGQEALPSFRPWEAAVDGADLRTTVTPAFTIGIAPALDSLVVLRYRVLKDFSGPRTELRFPLDLDWENRLEVFHRDGWWLGTLEDDPFPEIYGRRIYGNRDAGTLLVPVVQDFVALREYRLVALPRPLTGG